MNDARSPIHALGGETMGTTWCVRLVAPASADLRALHAGIQSRLDQVVAQMSTWEPESDISAYNRADAGNRVAVPDEFLAVLECALAVAEASGGAFNPAVGPLVSLWGFGADAAPRTAPSASRPGLS